MPLRGPARPLDLVRALGSSVTEHERRDAGTAGLGGFDAGSAASDVLAGIDLTGSTAVVTGVLRPRLETTRALTAAEVEVVVGAEALPLDAALQRADWCPSGKLAPRAGVATSALRYYDRIGRVTAECLGQRRHHPPSRAERVALIRL